MTADRHRRHGDPHLRGGRHLHGDPDGDRRSAGAPTASQPVTVGRQPGADGSLHPTADTSRLAVDAARFDRPRRNHRVLRVGLRRRRDRDRRNGDAHLRAAGHLPGDPDRDRDDGTKTATRSRRRGAARTRRRPRAFSSAKNVQGGGRRRSVRSGRDRRLVRVGLRRWRERRPATTAGHTYAASGTYTVSLTVTDNRGGTGTFAQPVTVAGPVNVAPTASFTHTESFLKVDVNAAPRVIPMGPSPATRGTSETAARRQVPQRAMSTRRRVRTRSR